MHRVAGSVHRDRDRHVLHVELVDRFHAEVLECQHAGAPYRFRYQVGRAAYGDQVHAAVALDRLHRLRAPLGLADGAEQPRLPEQIVHELVHAARGRRSGGPDHLFPHRVHRADVVDQAVLQVHRQLFPFRHQVGEPLVRGIAAGEDFPAQQQAVAGFPCRGPVLVEGLKIDAFRPAREVHCELWPVLDARRVEPRRPRPVEEEMHVARCGAVGDDRHRQGGGMGRIIRDLDVEHRGEPAQALRADAERIDLVEDLDAQLLGARLRAACLELVHVEGLEQRFLGEQHGFLGGAADADAQHARGAPVAAHSRHLPDHPVHHGIARVERHEARLVLRAAALGRELDLEPVTGDDFHVEDRRRVVARVPAAACRIGEHRGAQRVVLVGIGAAHAFVHHLLHAHLRVPAHIHPDLEEHHGHAGVLAHRPVAFHRHARVHQDLGDGVFGGGGLLALVGLGHGPDEVHRMVDGDELEAVGDALDEVLLLDRCHLIPYKSTT